MDPVKYWKKDFKLKGPRVSAIKVEFDDTGASGGPTNVNIIGYIAPVIKRTALGSCDVKCLCFHLGIRFENDNCEEAAYALLDVVKGYIEAHCKQGGIEAMNVLFNRAGYKPISKEEYDTIAKEFDNAVQIVENLEPEGQIRVCRLEHAFNF
jgi:hypothetical protein